MRLFVRVLLLLALTNVLPTAAYSTLGAAANSTSALPPPDFSTNERP